MTELSPHETILMTKELVTKRFTITFGPPPTADEVAFVDEYVRALAGTDINLLTRAIDYVIDNTESTYGTWPTPGTLRVAVTVIAERIRAHNERQLNAAAHEDDRPEPTAEQRANVTALMKAAAQAFKGGGWDLAKEKKKWAARQAAKAAAGDIGAQERLQVAEVEEARRQRAQAIERNIPRDASGRPDVSRTAWEKRYGKPPQQAQPVEPNYGYRGGEVDRE